MKDQVEATQYARKVSAYIRLKTENLYRKHPQIMIVLGSGCSKLTESIEIHARIPYSEIENMPNCTAPDHKGELILGEIENKPIIAFNGRHHQYEGHSATISGFLANVGYQLGAKVVITTSACGIAPERENRCNSYPADPGDIMLVESVFPNYLKSPLIGQIEGKMTRFPGMFDTPSISLNGIARNVAERLGINLQDAIYVPRTGPSYETPAEVTWLSHMSKIMGAPVLGGMSTIPTMEVASSLGMKTVGFGVVTNNMFNLEDKREVSTGNKQLFQLDEKGKTAYTLEEVQQVLDKEIKTRQPTHEEVKEAAGSDTVTENLEKLVSGLVWALRI